MDPITITPLTDQLNSFPHFMPNQVLTHTQLNELAAYLEQQGRFTRQRLIGIGILCGLQADLIVSGGTRTVEISRGVGLTSCGFLIDVPTALLFNKKKSYTTPDDYDPFLVGPGGTPITCLELKSNDSTESGVSALTNPDVTDKVVVAFLDIEDKPNGKCLGENCDEKGNKWLFRLRFLLISITDIDKVLKKAYTPNVFNNPLNSASQREDFFNPEYRLAPVFIERFGNTTNNANNSFNLSSIQSLQVFEDTYVNIIEKGSTRVARAIFDMYTLFKPLFDVQLQITANPFNGFDGSTPATNALAVKLSLMLQKGSHQYVFDFIRDIMDTYHELRDELCMLVTECSPDPTKFPRHLMLGILEDIDIGKFDPSHFSTPSVYRHHFLFSPLIDGLARHHGRAKMLISRLSLMLDSLNFQGLLTPDMNKEPIQIIPDRMCCSTLSEKRIPFYYNEGTLELIYFWNFKRTIMDRAIENRSYFASAFVPGSLPSDYKASLVSPQLFDIREFSKLSIEGHVGKELQMAVNELKLLREKYNLSFDILALKLGTDFNQIYIAEDNLIADIQAQYLVERNELVCCLRELRAYVEEYRDLIALLITLMIVIILTAYGSSLNTPLIIVLLFSIITNLLNAYINAIDVVVASLPPDIKEFSFQNLAAGFPVVDDITRLLKYIINTWGDIEFFLLQKGEGPNNPLWLMADLISIVLNFFEMYLDKLGDECIIAKFYTIDSIFQERLHTFCLFDRFNTHIHGMEHIAGTTWGGTFILVYEDEEVSQEISGEVTDFHGKPVEDAYIVSASNEKIIYGVTDKGGKYRARVPHGDDTVRILKPGHVGEEMKITKGKAKKAVMPSYKDAVSEKNTVGEKASAKVDNIYMNIEYSVNEIASLDKSFEKVHDYVKIEMAEINKDTVIVEDKRTFRVVADFHLPHLIHNYKTAVNPIDACEEISEPTIVNFDALAKVMEKQGKTRMKAVDKDIFNMYNNAKQ